MLETLPRISAQPPSPVPDKPAPDKLSPPSPTDSPSPAYQDQLNTSAEATAQPQATSISIPGLDNAAPSLAEVKKGAVLEQGQQGASIKELQRRLTALGFGIQVTGIYGPTTVSIVKAFQIAYQLAPTGKVGPTTLQALEKAEKMPRYNQSLGKTIAREAARIAYGRGTVGWCYRAVSDAVDRSVGQFLYGASAYMAATQLAKHSKFKEIKQKTPAELKKLPAGAIVVWGKTAASPHGHISVSLGNGLEASDHVDDQMTSLRGYRNYRVFIPAR